MIELGTKRYLNTPFPVLIVRHAELLTKMTRRELANLNSVPDVPRSAKLKRDAVLMRHEIIQKVAV